MIIRFPPPRLTDHDLYFDLFGYIPRQAVATRFLGDLDMSEEIRQGCITACQAFHVSTEEMTLRFRSELRRHNYVTPTSYLELIATYR